MMNVDPSKEGQFLGQQQAMGGAIASIPGVKFALLRPFLDAAFQPPQRLVYVSLTQFADAAVYAAAQPQLERGAPALLANLDQERPFECQEVVRGLEVDDFPLGESPQTNPNCKKNLGFFFHTVDMQ